MKPYITGGGGGREGKQNNRHKIREGEKKEDRGMANNRESW